MSASQRRKGKSFEQDVARRMRGLMPGVDVRRGWQSDGREAPDVQAGRLAIECKHSQRPNVLSAVKDAETHCPPGCIPIAVCRWNGGEELVAMRWNDFAKFVLCWAKGKKGDGE